MKKHICKLISMALVCVMVFSLTGCAAKSETEDLMDGVTEAAHAAVPITSDMPDKAADFAVRLFKECRENGKNTLISPLSVLAALAMAMNGAEGETLAQMEKAVGMSVKEVNEYFFSLMSVLPQTDKCRINLANSVWFTDDDGFTVSKEFLQQNADYLDADVFRTRFDSAALKAINDWVNENTDGMIPDILDQVQPNAIMYLINALAFEAEWENIFSEDEISDGLFTLEDGTKLDAEFMNCSEKEYLNDGLAEGFIKYYADRDYAFAALLPPEGMSLDDYVAGLDGTALRKLLSGAEKAQVFVSIPKFETKYDIELSEVLKKMGMPVAFSASSADFSGIGSAGGAGFYIDEVIHKTYIKVDEKGTRAGAATAIMIKAAGLPSQEIKRVYLDRPFVYMLIDTQTYTPFFIGTMNDISK